MKVLKGPTKQALTCTNCGEVQMHELEDFDRDTMEVTYCCEVCGSPVRMELDPDDD